MFTFLLCFSFFFFFDLDLGESKKNPKTNPCKFSILKEAFGFTGEAYRNVNHKKKML